MNKYKNLFHAIFLITIALICANFTDGAKKEADTNAIEYVALQEGENIISASLSDESNITELKEASFTGHSKIGGVRRESDDSITQLSLADIKALEVINESYTSPRYQDKEFILLKVISASGVETADFLVPRDVVICGIEKETNMAKAWYLRKIKKLEISMPEVKKEELPVVARPEVLVKKRNK
ncbi:hypothetical protein L6269_02470 [Candidatus Dependentiae bacterium]|nr:hypothetical protein [Candidatus Dependentiae bacterium]